MRTLSIKRGNFAAVVYTPDGGTLISLNSRRHVRFWDLATFAERLSFTLPAGSGSDEGRLMLAGDLLIANTDAWEAADVLERLKGPPGGRRRVWLVTQPFHARRALFYFRRAGFDPRAWQIEGGLEARRPGHAIRWILREYAAWALALSRPNDRPPES